MLTAKEIQEILQVDRSTIYRMAEDGRLPAIKVGRQWRFEPQVIDGWLSARGMSATPALIHHTSDSSMSEQASNLQTLLPMECVQLMQDTFAEALGAMIIITDMTGQPVTQVSNPCGLFEALSEVDDLWEKCISHWRDMAQTIELEPAFMVSSLGLLCARGLIRVDSELVGMVMVGGFKPDEWPPTAEQIEMTALDFGVEPSLLDHYIDDNHVLNPGDREKVLRLTQRIANVTSHIISERTQIMSVTNNNRLATKELTP